MLISKITGDEMKDIILRTYWVDKSHTRIYSLQELFSTNTTDERIIEYHRLAKIELRKQKIDKLWKKTQA